MRASPAPSLLARVCTRSLEAPAAAICPSRAEFCRWRTSVWRVVLLEVALTLSVTNAHARLPAEVTIDLRGRAAQDVSISVLADEDIHAHNTFEEPQRLLPRPETTTHALQTHTFPPASVTVIKARLS